MPERPRIVVIGSANQDLVVRTERIPAPGETVLGSGFVTLAGGKGANQAVAAARLGGEVWFVGRVGTDAFGDSLADEMQSAGIHTEFLVRDAETPTGVALIGVDTSGQNAIIVASGANHRLSRVDVDAARSSIAAAFAVVIQLEIPIDTVAYAIETARSVGTRVILNPAPVQSANTFADSLLAKVDVLTPNEHEALQLCGMAGNTNGAWDAVARRLLAKGPRAVIITLGKEGCLIADQDGIRPVAALTVRPVDTTAAGDCFTGALAVALGEGRSLDESASFASRAAAISTMQFGAQPSLPKRSEVDQYCFTRL